MSRFVIVNDRVRQNAIDAVKQAPIGYAITVSDRKRSLDQNAHFHALCSDIAKSGLKWAGKMRNESAWKAILVSGHAVATGEGGEVIPGLEGEFVAIRESTASMGVKRAASLIEYTQAFCLANEIALVETRNGGFYE